MKSIRKALSWNEIQSSHRLMLLIVFILGVLNFFWGEKVPAAGGLGWDGVYYAHMVRHLGSMLSGGQLSGYYAQRILPSGIVRGLLLISGAAMSDANIIRMFEMYNLLLLLGACWAWKRVANVFSIGLAGRWLGFSALFINFEASKQAFYYPVLTDVTALFVGMLLLLFYVEKKPIALFVTTIIGAFCWPVTSICGAFLLLFLKSDLPREVVAPPALTGRTANIARLVLLGSFVLLALCVLAYVTLALTGPVPEQACNVPKILADRMPHGSNPCALERLLTAFKRLLTGLPSLIGMLVALAMLIGSRSFFPAVLASLRKVRLPLAVLAAAAFFIPFLMVKAIHNPTIVNVSGLLPLMKGLLFPRAGKFLLPIVTLAVFWGPLLLLLLLYWKAFCVEARRLGPGVVAILGIALPLGVVGEPRFLTIAWPFLVLGMVLAFQSSRTKASFKYVFAALTILYAQFWMKLNLAPWSQGDYDDLLSFPKQLYFMHYGLWMSWWSYSIQLIALVLSAMWLHKLVVQVGVTDNDFQAASDVVGVVQR